MVGLASLTRACCLVFSRRCHRPSAPQPFAPLFKGLQVRHRGTATVNAAKKGGKKGGGVQKKTGSAVPKAPPPPYLSTDVIMHNLMLIESFSRQVGQPMMEDVEIMHIGKLLWEAPFGLISHDKYLSGEPKIIYANKVALEAFGCDWGGLVGVSLDDKRAAVGEESSGDGGNSFGGQFESASGQKFSIQDATVWKVEGPSGKVMGEAVMFFEWEYDDGQRAGPAAPVDTPPPTQQDIVEAEIAIEQQAALVRQLKEERGLTNQDEEVQSAVSELLQRKQHLEEMKNLLIET